MIASQSGTYFFTSFTIAASPFGGSYEADGAADARAIAWRGSAATQAYG
jgi:hypothetical protein